MKNIGLRIKVKRKLSGLTQEGLGNAVGVSKVAVSRWEAGKNAINPELIQTVANVLSVDVEWLLTGEHFATKEDEAAAVFWAPSYKKNKASTGLGFCIDDCIADLTPIPIKYLQYQSNRDKIFCVCVSGDSMSPVLSDGAIIAVNGSDTSIKDGKMYLIKQEDLLRVKILQLLPTDIILKSYNPDFKDEICKLKNNNMQIIGKVFWFSSGVK